MADTRRQPAKARTAILSAATELIRERGVAGTSISDVIAASGTSAGAIYHHFGSKDRLVLEVGRAAMAVPMTMILQTSPDLSPADLFAAAIERVAQEDGLAEMLLQIWSGAQADPRLADALSTEIGAARTNIAGVISDWCARFAPHVEPDELVTLLMGLVAGFAVLRAVGVGEDPAGFQRLAVDLLAGLTREATATSALEEPPQLS